MAYGSQIPGNRGTITNDGGTKIGNTSIPKDDNTGYPTSSASDSPTEETTTETTITPVLGDIVFRKKIYSRSALNNNIDNSFSELIQLPSVNDLSEFFDMYSQIFFDIPKEGENSHTKLVQESTEYLRDYNDPKDAVIASLEQQIIDLESQLNDPLNKQEHPVFRNGTFIKTAAQGGNWYYMDKGYKRYVQWDNDMVNAILLASNGTTDSNLVPIVNQNMLDNIPQGYPNLKAENFGDEFDPTNNESNNIIQFLNYYYDNNGDPDVNPYEYDSREEYITALEEDIDEKTTVFVKLQKRIRDEFNPQIITLKNLDPVYFEETYGSNNSTTTETTTESGTENTSSRNSNRSY
jgi:hypothetical protein